jgi:predicted nucleic acid-binding protein
VYLVDTNVFVYAVGDSHRLRDRAQALIRAAESGLVSISTTPYVVQEFAHVCGTRRSRAETDELARDVARAGSPLLPAVEQDVPVALTLFREHRRLDAFDALLAAVAIREQTEGLISADRGFRAVPGLRWVDLADLDVEQLVAGR